MRLLKKGLCLSAIFFMTSSCGLGIVKGSDVVELEIISEMVKETDPAFHKRDPECLEWKMTKDDILLSFSKMRKVAPVEWGAWCPVYSCFYIGKARYHGRIYSIEVNAASFISLTEEVGENTLYFIGENPSPLFIVPCNCCEESEPISE